MNKEEMVQMYNGILFGHEKERNKAVCSNMGATRDYHAEGI